MNMGRDDNYDFERLPRGRLNFSVSRRQFFPALLQEFLAYCDSIEGRPAHNLAELGLWADEDLYRLCPRIAPECKIHVQDGLVWAQHPTSKQPIKLFPIDSPARVAFNEMNGLKSLREIAQQVQSITDWDEQRSFAYVRGLFLWLVFTKVCRPDNA